MNGERVDDIAVGRTDYTGLEIGTVYSKVPRVYAVYSNSDRVMIQYADDESLATEQRLALAHLAPLRGEINGLIDGWRSPRTVGSETGPTHRASASDARAKRYDRRTADALIVALQGDQASAMVLLEAIKREIVEERTSTGRVQYVVTAGLVAFVIFLLFWAFNDLNFPKFVSRNNTWMATSIGCLGAFFSIAIGIRGRTIQTDLRLRDNLVDAGLRIVIGAISAVVLFALFRSELFKLTLGEAGPIRLCVTGPECTSPQIDIAIVVAFLAGFSERLVGNLLDTKLVPALGENPAVVQPVVAKTDLARSEADERNPRGLTAPPRLARPSAAETDENFNDQVDSCLCDVELEDGEITEDINLPKASGGVEKPSVH
ncbi:hypothetical protein [Rhizobium sp. BK176]|uniref:hypothetical protein n=1 Tax=Rhizobium sp. BK176 TaxID=2587071 RepID=UPI0021687F9F|nr:hypothetical protein [Rhizobium sp. BK176]MCS4096731.1 hypothetical protein [Rhizobium sp. BK176]